MRSFTFAAIVFLLSRSSAARAEIVDNDRGPSTRTRWGLLAVEATAGPTSLARSSFTESGSDVSPAHGNFSATGRDLGYAHPFMIGGSFLALRFLTPAFALGVEGGLSFGLASPTPNASTAWTEPGGLSLIHLGFVAETIVLEGPTSLRLGLVGGGRIVSIALHAPQFQSADESALDAVLTPRLSLVHDWGTWGVLGAYVGAEFVSADMASPSLVGGFYVGLD